MKLTLPFSATVMSEVSLATIFHSSKALEQLELFDFSPVSSYFLIYRLSIRKSGLRVQYVRGQRLVYCYAERGTPSAEQSTLVFVHGFSAGKDSWLGTIQV